MPEGPAVNRNEGAVALTKVGQEGSSCVYFLWSDTEQAIGEDYFAGDALLRRPWPFRARLSEFSCSTQRCLCSSLKPHFFILTERFAEMFGRGSAISSKAEMNGQEWRQKMIEANQ